MKNADCAVGLDWAGGRRRGHHWGVEEREGRRTGWRHAQEDGDSPWKHCRAHLLCCWSTEHCCSTLNSPRGAKDTGSAWEQCPCLSLVLGTRCAHLSNASPQHPTKKVHVAVSGVTGHGSWWHFREYHTGASNQLHFTKTYLLGGRDIKCDSDSQRQSCKMSHKRPAHKHYLYCLSFLPLWSLPSFWRSHCAGTTRSRLLW